MTSHAEPAPADTPVLLTAAQLAELLVLVTRELGDVQDNLARGALQQQRTPADAALEAWLAAYERRRAVLTALRQALLQSLTTHPEEE